jgi:nucleotide-binding universal stress UspA family protein
MARCENARELEPVMTSIVCGIEDTARGRAAAHLAGSLAERLGLELVAVHALSYPPSPSLLPAAASVPTAAAQWGDQRESSRRIHDVLRSAGVRDALVRVESGAAAHRLATIAEPENAALIVVATRGTGSIRSTVVGSVTADLFHIAPCPIAVVPPHPRQPILDGPVVVGVGDRGDAAWVPVAGALARAYEVPLLLAHVVNRGDTARPVPDEARAPGTAEALEAARHTIDGDEDGPALRICHGRPGEALLALADEQRATFLAVGTRGHGSLRAGLIGSTARQLASESTVPVVVCPPGMREAAGAHAARLRGL